MAEVCGFRVLYGWFYIVIAVRHASTESCCCRLLCALTSRDTLPETHGVISYAHRPTAQPTPFTAGLSAVDNRFCRSIFIVGIIISPGVVSQKFSQVFAAALFLRCFDDVVLVGWMTGKGVWIAV